MAQRGKPIPATTMTQIIRLRRVLSLRQTAREIRVSKNTVTKYARRRQAPADHRPDESMS